MGVALWETETQFRLSSLREESQRYRDTEPLNRWQKDISEISETCRVMAWWPCKKMDISQNYMWQIKIFICFAICAIVRPARD